jgi:hypothetical protein
VLREPPPRVVRFVKRFAARLAQLGYRTRPRRCRKGRRPAPSKPTLNARSLRIPLPVR